MRFASIVLLAFAIAGVTSISIWPQPQSATSGSTTIELDANFNFVSRVISADLSAAFERYHAMIFAHKTRATEAVNALSLLEVTVSNLDTPLAFGVDESYVLTIPTLGGTASIEASTVFGAYRGLETFSQLVVFNATAHRYVIPQGPWTIKDAPRFPHRGVLMDTSRHFQPVSELKMLIDSLAYAKFNVLHWHVVDTQSFPLESKTYPKLWDGAYSEDERYTQEDVSELVEYARLRGIRVMIEVDNPGHAAAMCTGYPEVCPALDCREPLNVANEATFTLLESLFGEMTGNVTGGGLFPDEFFHLGGDEVYTGCWTNDPQISAWLASHNMTAKDGYKYFVKRVHDMVIAQGRSPVNWEEVFLNFGTDLDPRTIIHVWLDHATLAKVVAAGYRGILSDQANWYLDHLATTWQTMYLNEPFTNITDAKQQSLVLGGEACMWGETVDASDLFNTVWPRAAAVSERLWSDQTVNDVDAALPRLERFRCLLTVRGVGAAPVQNAQARSAPPHPGSCFAQ